MTAPYVDPDSIAVVGTGDPVPSSLFSTYADNSEFLARPPGCIVNRTTALTVAPNSFTPLPFNATDIRDTDNFHSTTTNNTRMTVPTGLGGLYMVGANIGWATPSATGIRIVRLRKNGTTEIGSVDAPGHGANVVFQNLNIPMYLNAGDYIEVMLLHNAPINLDTYPLIAQMGWMHLIGVS